MNKIISVLVLFCCITNVYAYELKEEYTRVIDEEEYLYQIYEVNDKETFDVPKQIETNKGKYELYQYSIGSDSYEEEIEIVKTEKTVTNTKNKDDIVQQLPNEIAYNENGYEGKYILDKESLKIETNYNGYKEYLVEKEVEYNNLDKNDLSYIPKQVKKGSWTLDLITTKWIVETTKMIGDNEVPNTYTAKCYYATKYKKDNPYTYTVTATYKGKAVKVIETPCEYHIEYKRVKENNTRIILTTVSSGIIIALMLLVRNNKIKIYANKGNKYKYLGKVRYNKKEGLIDITRKTTRDSSNNYKLKFGKSLLRKLENKTIRIQKNNITKYMVVDERIKEISI